MRKTFSFHSKAVMIWSNERTNGRIRWQMKMGNNFTPNKCKTHSRSKFNLRKRCSVSKQAEYLSLFKCDRYFKNTHHHVYSVLSPIFIYYEILSSFLPSMSSMRQLSTNIRKHTHSLKQIYFYTRNIRHSFQVKIQNAVTKDQKKQLYAHTV